MNLDADLLGWVYVGVMLGSAVLLAVLWRILPGLLREEITRADIPTDAPLLPARGSSIRIGPALRQQ